MIGTKLIAGGLVGLVLTTALYLGYRHYTGMLEEMKGLHAAQAQHLLALDVERQSVRSLRSVVEEWERSQAELEETLEEMQEQAHAARAESRRLRRLFAEIDIESLSAASADSLADTTTARLWKLIQAATGDDRPRGGSDTASEATAPSTGSNEGTDG